MSITGNISNEIGDVFIIRADSPIIGLIALTDYIDTTSGSFNKEFRYTVDGINYSSWEPLTNDNISAVEVVSTDTFIIEYRYTSTSINSSFSDITVNGQIVDTYCGKVYQDSIFAQFFSCSDTEVLGWCINVTGKLYNQGIIANYVKRGDENNINGIDRDYIDFWRTVACFFAYIVYFARNFQDFRNNEDLLSDFLDQRGIFFCQNDEPLEKNYLVENYFDEIRQRGTSKIYKTKTENNSLVHGELLRTICYNTNDEFIFNLYLPKNVGWNLGHSSPLFNTLENQPATNRAYEDTQDFIDLDLYPIFGNGTQNIISDGSKEVYRILNVPDGEITGIGDSDLDYKINVDPNLDYEICFWVRQPVLEANLTFGLLSYDIDNNVSSLAKVTDATNENNFFETIQLANTDDYFFVRGILYNKDVNFLVTENDTFGGGINLKMKSETDTIIPYIVLDNTSGGDALNELRIWDLKIRPLSTTYSTGFVNPKNFISMWIRNNNGMLSNDQIESRLRRFLLPYNTSFKINYLEDSIELFDISINEDGEIIANFSDSGDFDIELDSDGKLIVTSDQAQNYSLSNAYLIYIQ